MGTFVFDTNAVKTFTKFQTRLTKEETRNILFPPPPLKPGCAFFSSAASHMRFSTHYQKRLALTNINQAQKLCLEERNL